jgi:3-methyladenine DNA glycosylase AlkD
MRSAERATTALARLQALADEATSQGMRRFFKTGPGEYGAGDRFLGIKATPLRQLAREFQTLPLEEITQLLHSPLHEARSLALLILVRTFPRVQPEGKKAIYDLYLANTARVNNWDLVDLSAGPLVGGYLVDSKRGILDRLARSASLWERRIAIVATHHFIRRDDFADTFRIAALLLGDQEDLIHKAVGWMLREVGKRDQPAEEEFLREHYRNMPRTALRYAIERFSEEKRKKYLRGEV